MIDCIINLNLKAGNQQSRTRKGYFESKLLHWIINHSLVRESQGISSTQRTVVKHCRLYFALQLRAKLLVFGHPTVPFWLDRGDRTGCLDVFYRESGRTDVCLLLSICTTKWSRLPSPCPSQLSNHEHAKHRKKSSPETLFPQLCQLASW